MDRQRGNRKGSVKTVYRMVMKQPLMPVMRPCPSFFRTRPTSLLVGLVALIALMSTGCASGRLQNARSDFYRGNPELAEKHLEKPITGRDRLLYLMESGAIRHHLGRLDESIASFLDAAELIERQDVISLSRQAGSLVANEWVTEFKGEICERLWVHTYLMMNFLLAGRYESARVEAMRALKHLESHPETLADDHFTRALIGLCFEQLHEWNDAYIAYRNLARHMKDPAPLAPLLSRLSDRLGFPDETDPGQWTSPENPDSYPPNVATGEVIIFISRGRGPGKIPGNIFIPPATRISFPRYENRTVSPARYTARANGYIPTPFQISTDVLNVAKASLRARAARIIAKQTARTAAREIVVRSVERRDDALGLFLRLLMFVVEEADTRSWATLPAHLTLLRLPLPPGPRQVTLIIKNHRDDVTDTWISPEIDVQPRRNRFFSLRLSDHGTILSLEQ